MKKEAEQKKQQAERIDRRAVCLKFSHFKKIEHIFLIFQIKKRLTLKQKNKTKTLIIIDLIFKCLFRFSVRLHHLKIL